MPLTTKPSSAEPPAFELARVAVIEPPMSRAASFQTTAGTGTSNSHLSLCSSPLTTETLSRVSRKASASGMPASHQSSKPLCSDCAQPSAVAPPATSSASPESVSRRQIASRKPVSTAPLLFSSIRPASWLCSAATAVMEQRRKLVLVLMPSCALDASLAQP